MLENHRLRRSYTAIMLHLALDLVSLCSVFKGDTDDYIQKFGKTLKETCKNNPNIAILDTGSRVEGLYLPHVEGGRKLNVDAEHMIIRSDVTAYEMVDQGSTKTESYIHKTNEEEDITQNRIIFKNEMPFFDSELQYNFTKGDILYLHNGCHQGYVFLSTKKSFADMKFFGHLIEENCLNSARFVPDSLELVKINFGVDLHDVGCRVGPSFTRCMTGGIFHIDRDFVFALKCKSWPDQAREWLTRRRNSNWPSENQIKSIASSGCFIVPVASHHNSRLKDYEWRLSFSEAELKLIKNLPENAKFGYAVIKAVVKYDLGRLQLTGFASYHLKTCLLWFAERFGFEKIQRWTVEKIMHALLESLIKFYSEGCLPNYFVLANNMIDHRDQSEIKKCVSALRDIKGNLLQVMIHYIDKCHKLLVEFDQSLTEYFNFDNNEVSQLIKYNLLLMYLFQQLRAVADPSYTHVNKQFLQKACSLHKNDNKIHTNEVLNELNEEISIYGILEMLGEYLEADNLSITEKSGITLGVFNLVLTVNPDLTEKKLSEKKIVDFEEYTQKCSVFIEVLRWASVKHELYADQIYEFVVKNWVDGPKLVSGDEKTIPFMKLLMVIFGKPTKQSKAVNGSLVKQEKTGELFLTYRHLVSFVLFYDLGLAYLLYQIIAWLMNKRPLDEIWLSVQCDVWIFKRIRAIKLIIAHDELKDALTAEQKNHIRKFKIFENDLT